MLCTAIKTPTTPAILKSPPPSASVKADASTRPSAVPTYGIAFNSPEIAAIPAQAGTFSVTLTVTDAPSGCPARTATDVVVVSLQ